jgi:hypothetical protein
MSLKTIQQNMKSVLEVIRGYHELIGVRNTTVDKKELKKLEKELEKKQEYILSLLEKVKDLIGEEKKDVSY